MSGQSENTHQQHQHGRPVLDVVVQLAGDPTQTEQPDHLERAEQAADALNETQTVRKKVKNSSSLVVRRQTLAVFAFINGFTAARPCASSVTDASAASDATTLHHWD